MMKDQTLYIVLGGIIIAVMAVFFPGGTFLVLVFGLLCWAIYTHSPEEDRVLIVRVLIAGFLVRASAAIAMSALSYYQGYEGLISGDDLLYTVRGWAIVHRWEGKPDDWIQSLTGMSEHGVNPLTFTLAVFYKVFGFHPMAAKFINCILGTMIGWMTYLVGRETFGNRAAKISMSIVIFYPSFIRWSAANLKDPLVTLSFLVCVYTLIVAAARKMQVWRYLVFILFASALYFFPHRFHFILILAGALLAVFLRLFGLIRQPFARKTVSMALTIVLISGTFYILYINPAPLIELIYKCEDKQFTVAGSDYAGYHLYPKAFMESLDKGVLPAWGFAEVVSLNTAYFMLTPFPWQMTSRERLAAYPQMMVWYILLALSLFGFARLALSKPGTALLLGVLVSAGVILQALAEGNIGAAFRHRDVFTAFFIIFASGVLAGIFHGGSRR